MSDATVSPASVLGLWTQLRRQWDRLAVYLPLILMAVLALLSYWLAHNAPKLTLSEVEPAPRHVQDYFMRDFSIRQFDIDGRLKSELQGQEGRHYPDTDTLEIDQVQVHTFSPNGRITTAHADKGLSNADGTEVQLFGHAVIVREPFTASNGSSQPRSELRSEFLHLFTDTEKIRTHLPVELIRGENDRFTADRMDYDNLDQVMQLQGRVHGVIQPHTKTAR